jgi:hypothetical protein
MGGTAILLLYPEQRLVLAILVNSDNTLNDMASRIAGWYLDGVAETTFRPRPSHPRVLAVQAPSLFAQTGDTPEARLAALGLTLPEPPRPVANYVEAVRSGILLYLAGHGPCDLTHPVARGKVGRELTTEQASAARSPRSAFSRPSRPSWAS